MFAASATRTNAGIAARQGMVPSASPNINLVNAGLRLTIERLRQENQVLAEENKSLQKRLLAYGDVSQDAYAVIDEMATRYGIPAEKIRDPHGSKTVVIARHHAQYEIKRRCPWMSSTEIAKIFGGKDHSTILYAIREWPKKAAILGIPCLPLEVR